MESTEHSSPDDRLRLDAGIPQGPALSSFHRLMAGPREVGAVILRGGSENEHLAMVEVFGRVADRARAELATLFMHPRLYAGYKPTLGINAPSYNNRSQYIDEAAAARSRGHWTVDLQTGLIPTPVARHAVAEAAMADFEGALLESIRALAEQARSALRAQNAAGTAER